MDYEVEIVETLSRTIQVDANSEHDVYLKIWNKYRHCDIVLDSEDYVDTEFIVRPVIANEENRDS